MQNYYDELIRIKNLPDGWNLVGTGVFKYYYGGINFVPGDVETKYSIGELIKVIDGKWTHATRIFIIPGEPPKVSTVAITHEPYRGRGLFSEARKLVEEDIIPIIAKEIGASEVIFEVSLVNKESELFLRKWFKKNGYKEDGKVLKKVLRL